MSKPLTDPIFLALVLVSTCAVALLVSDLDRVEPWALAAAGIVLVVGVLVGWS